MHPFLLYMPKKGWVTIFPELACTPLRTAYPCRILLGLFFFFNPFNHKLLTKTFYSLSICTVKDANKFQAHKSVSRRMNFQMKSPQKSREVLWLLCLGTLCQSTQLHIVTKQESSVSSECFLFFSHNVKGNTTRRQLGQIFCSGRKRSTL